MSYLLKRHPEDETSDHVFKTILSIICVAGILIGSILSFSPYQKANNPDYIEKKTTITNRTCASFVCIYNVNYIVDFSTYNKMFVDYSFNEQKNNGDSITIYYNKNNPNLMTTKNIAPFGLSLMLSCAIYLFGSLLSGLKKKLLYFVNYHWYDAIAEVILALFITIGITLISFAIGWLITFAPIFCICFVGGITIVFSIFSKELFKTSKNAKINRDKWFRNNGKIIDVTVDSIICESLKDGKPLYRAKCFYKNEQKQKKIMYSELTTNRLDLYFLKKNQKLQLIAYIDPRNPLNYYIPVEYLFN